MNIMIGQFNESFPPIMDGVANVVKNYAYWLNKKYGPCCVVTPKHPDAADDYEYPVYRYSSVKVPTRHEYRFGLPQMHTSFWLDLKRVPFDIVHAHCPFTSGFAARTIARKRDIPMVATFHSKYKDDFKVALKSDVIVEGVLQMIAAFYESADEVWTVNDASVETLREYGYRGDVYIMENGCDIDIRYPSPEADALVESRLGIPAGVPLLMYIGQHIWQKNLKMVIEALGILHNRDEKFHMLFVGDGARRADMEHMVAEAGMTDCVTFAGRVQDRDLVASVYLRSSAMLFPSLYDTSSLVPREAAACGCPTVLVRGSSTAQGITDGENGFLVDNSAAALAEAIAYILHHPDRVRQVGGAARSTVYRSWEDAIDVAYQRYLYLIDLKKARMVEQA